MNRFIAALALAATLALGGCATLDPTAKSILQGGPSVTAVIGQPISKQNLLAVETAYQSGLLAVASYRRFCYSAPLPSLPAFCQSRRRVMLAAQDGVSKAAVIMKSLRYFVANNDTVNALTAFNTARQLVADLSASVAIQGARP